MTHSPLPWREDKGWILDANGNDVASGYDHCPFDREKDDAKLAVTAVNAHAALVAALEMARSRLTNYATIGHSPWEDSTYEQIDAALELARKGGA